jgi:hypothetical protein
MRRIDYELWHPIGAGTTSTSGTLKDLVLAIPYLMLPGLIPPLHVLNAELKKGAGGAGMSGGATWEPFEITAAEYDELVASFEGGEPRRSTQGETPEWVETHRDWTIWALHLLRGIPVDEHRRLAAEYTELQRQYKDAQAAGDSELTLTLFVQSVQVGTRLGEFVMANRGTADRKDEPA